MTPPHQPPPQPPEDDGDRQGMQPPPGYVPPGYPGGPPPGYQGGYPYQQPPRREPKISVGTAFAGIFVYFVINFIVGLLAFMVGGAIGTRANGVFIAAAVLLVLIAFGGGAMLLKNGSPSAKGIGLGLMIGWAVTSLLTAGFCTGLNPTMYTS